MRYSAIAIIAGTAQFGTFAHYNTNWSHGLSWSRESFVSRIGLINSRTNDQSVWLRREVSIATHRNLRYTRINAWEGA